METSLSSTEYGVEPHVYCVYSVYFIDLSNGGCLAQHPTLNISANEKGTFDDVPSEIGIFSLY